MGYAVRLLGTRAKQLLSEIGLIEKGTVETLRTTARAAVKRTSATAQQQSTEMAMVHVDLPSEKQNARLDNAVLLQVIAERPQTIVKTPAASTRMAYATQRQRPLDPRH